MTNGSSVSGSSLHIALSVDWTSRDIGLMFASVHESEMQRFLEAVLPPGNCLARLDDTCEWTDSAFPMSVIYLRGEENAGQVH